MEARQNYTAQVHDYFIRLASFTTIHAKNNYCDIMYNNLNYL